MEGDGGIMKRMSGRAGTLGVAALLLGSALSGPAAAAEIPQARDQVKTQSVSTGIDNPDCPPVPSEPLATLCVQWTGGWPDGEVWAWGNLVYYRVRLEKCVVDSCTSKGWATAATSPPSGENAPVTARVPAAKTGWYRACGQTISGGPWSCMPDVWAVYLGD